MKGCYVLVVALQLQLHFVWSGKLYPEYYGESCPNAESIVRDVMKKSLITEPRSVASVMRFQFHDCFVQGCDASMLLDDTESMKGEKLSLSNINSLRSYQVIDSAKEALERECPGVVSCADILVMAARDAVGLTGGPHWSVNLGRLDSLSASRQLSDDIMPSPRSNVSALLSLFGRYNLSAQDLVALSGSHSIGEGRCFSIMFRLYGQGGDTGGMDPAFRDKLTKLCPKTVDQNVTGPLDSTPLLFDNRYFKDVVAGRAFLNSDHTLYSSPLTTPWVDLYSIDQNAFFLAFSQAMIKMGDLQSGLPGEIRTNCRRINNNTNNPLLSFSSFY